MAENNLENPMTPQADLCAIMTPRSKPRKRRERVCPYCFATVESKRAKCPYCKQPLRKKPRHERPR